VSRYLILVILNTPLVIVGILNALTSYKLNHIGKRRLILRITLWLIIFTGILFVQPLYNFLFSHRLTQTEPLSLFDVIQITGIILAFLIANHAYTKADTLERRIQDLHQELSIRLSEDKPTKQTKP